MKVNGGQLSITAYLPQPTKGDYWWHLEWDPIIQGLVPEAYKLIHEDEVSAI